MENLNATHYCKEAWTLCPSLKENAAAETSPHQIITEEEQQKELELKSYLEFVQTVPCRVPFDSDEIYFYITTFEDNMYPYFVFIKESSQLHGFDLRLKAKVYKPSKTNLIINTMYKPIQMF